MRQRHLYILLFSVPALIAALLAGFVVLAGTAGVMWLFVYGDNPWPGGAEAVLVVVFAAVSLAAWAVLLRRAYRAGEEHERAGAPPRPGGLAIAAAGITALLLVLVGLHQWNVGNIGPKPDSVVCSDFCAPRLPGQQHASQGRGKAHLHLRRRGRARRAHRALGAGRRIQVRRAPVPARACYAAGSFACCSR